VNSFINDNWQRYYTFLKKRMAFKSNLSEEANQAICNLAMLISPHLIDG